MGRVLHPHIPHDHDNDNSSSSRRGLQHGSLGGGTRNVASLQQLWGINHKEGGGGANGYGGYGGYGPHDDYDSEDGDDDDDDDGMPGAAKFHRERLQAMNARSGLQFAANPR